MINFGCFNEITSFFVLLFEFKSYLFILKFGQGEDEDRKKYFELEVQYLFRRFFAAATKK